MKQDLKTVMTENTPEQRPLEMTKYLKVNRSHLILTIQSRNHEAIDAADNKAMGNHWLNSNQTRTQQNTYFFAVQITNELHHISSIMNIHLINNKICKQLL